MMGGPRNIIPKDKNIVNESVVRDAGTMCNELMTLITCYNLRYTIVYLDPERQRREVELKEIRLLNAIYDIIEEMYINNNVCITFYRGDILGAPQDYEIMIYETQWDSGIKILMGTCQHQEHGWNI